MTVETLIAESTAQRRVCPQPKAWKELWEMLPARIQKGAGWEPPLPLILGAWHYTSDLEKRERFHLHLRWADQHGALPAVATFLSKLSTEDWQTNS